MSRPQVRIYTGEGQFIDREMNDDEFAQYQLDQADRAARDKTKAEEEAEAASKRQAALGKLEALGLTTDDLKALGL